MHHLLFYQIKETRIPPLLKKWADRTSMVIPCRDIGQKALIKTAVIVENSMATAVLSCLKEDSGWTKRVDKKSVKH